MHPAVLRLLAVGLGLSALAAAPAPSAPPPDAKLVGCWRTVEEPAERQVVYQLSAKGKITAKTATWKDHAAEVKPGACGKFTTETADAPMHGGPAPAPGWVPEKSAGNLVVALTKHLPFPIYNACYVFWADPAKNHIAYAFLDDEKEPKAVAMRNDAWPGGRYSKLERVPCP